MLFPGAPSSLRGYRLQHLYSLFRILESEGSDGYVFRLEGSEDVEVFDRTGRLVESVQVKARSGAPLAPSALTTPSGESFFARSRQRLASYPESKQRVVSFGEIGPTLQSLDGRSGESRDEQDELLGRLGVPASESVVFRSAFEVERVHEEVIARAVMARLAASVTGGNAEVAFLFLSGWMYRQMEERRTITAADVRDKLLAVGRFIAENQAHAAEWFTTIVPLEEERIDDARRALLLRDFYEGVSARFEHILAGVDVVRPGKIAEIGGAFAKGPVVLVHGASGQGKTALALRYLLTANPSAWRFRIRELENLPHARRVALALRAHADAIGVPMIVWFDVTPQDIAWTRVVEELEALPQTRVLVTIREEDWTRARNAGATLRYAEVALALDQDEARQIFDGLQQYRVSADLLDFDDAWRQFGGGPLMEFSYLVTRGDALETKLEQQVRRLREEVRRGVMSGAEIELLRRVAVATAAGGGVRLQAIVADLSLGDPKASLDLFEREYLLRVSPDGSSAEGLHPLRSATLARLLTADVLDQSWIDTAIAVLPAVHESDIEAFLLSIFSRPGDVAALKSALNTFAPKSWSGGAGIVRAFLWLGMQEYVSANVALISEVVERRNGTEIALSVLDPAGLEAFSPGLTDLMDEMFSATEDLQAWYGDIRARKPSSACVTRDAAAWLLANGMTFDPPSSPGDWAGMAELLFWWAAWHLRSVDDAARALSQLVHSAEIVPLDSAADAVLALSFWDDQLPPAEFEEVRQSFVARFREAMHVFLLQCDDGAMAHYIATLEESENLHDETIRRLSLMRRLLPDDVAFGARAYGHIFGGDLFPHDPSLKKDVPASSFPIRWVVRLTRLFSFIAGVQMRGASWGVYADMILKLRRRVANLASETSAALRRYFNKDKPRSVFDLGMEKQEWFQVSLAVNDLPRVPASAVDAWGVELRHAGNQQAFELPPEHAEWSEVLRTYANHVYNFLEASTPYLLANPHIGRPVAGSAAIAAQVLVNTNFKVHLATHYLAEVVRVLPRLQRLYRARFSRFFSSAALAQLEADERSWIWSLWAVWYQFAEQPGQKFSDARHESLAAVEGVRRKRLTDLKRRLASIGDGTIILHQERGQGEEAQGLWVTMDVAQSAAVYAALEHTLAEIIEALRPPPDFHAFDWYVLDLLWRDVHIVPMVRGRSLARTAWHFRIVTLPQPGESIEAWRLLELPVDEGIWRDLNLLTWSPTLGGPARRLQAELASVLALLSHLLRFEEAPEPDEMGAAILDRYGREVLDAIGNHSSNAVAAARECSNSLLRVKDNPLAEELEAERLLAGEEVLATCEHIDEDLKMIEPFAFDALRSLIERLQEFSTTTLTGVLHQAIDQELSFPRASRDTTP